ncbi:MAG: low molecular weight protein-tyrosine-phosphatase [Ignavibacteriaceae bacterium]|jgi:protein-tyrosine phosphatase|nr:low molecular weight protein-tyrosine-phosphatase [Ignavibacteriaceae bacterium]
MIKVLFVCTGNICRSPAAEGIMEKKLIDSGLDKYVETDSAGTIGYHTNELPDERMRKNALKRGYKLEHYARKFNPDIDGKYFDYILVMDEDNYNALIRMDVNGTYSDKILRTTDFSSDNKIREVPDPYYGGDEEFERVLDILENSIDNFLKTIVKEIEKRNIK